jgi:phage baseplate assembly protein W
MAFGARKVFPNDLRPRVAIGFDLPINGEAVFTSNYQTKDAIKNNLINFFLTNPGERPGNPSFGGGLREFIFTQIQTDNLEFLKDDIQTKIDTEFGNINVLAINIFEQPNNNRVLVQIKYNVPNTGINDKLELSFS